MKLNLFIFFILLSLAAKAKSDSATVFFTYPNEETMLLNQLNDIKYINIICKDKKAKGCHFFLSVDEYKNGKLNKLDKYSDTCIPETIMFLVGKDTVREKIDLCDKITFGEKDSVFKITIAGKLNGRKFRMIQNFPAMSTEVELKAKNDFTLKEINCINDGEMKMALNQTTAILSFSPPFKSESGSASSYCILGTEEVNKWYQKFKVKHYYIINLKICKK
ncbi:MAG: hypothetical protein RIQ33_1698 [Bacteroidota bacterium]